MTDYRPGILSLFQDGNEPLYSFEILHRVAGRPSGKKGVTNQSRRPDFDRAFRGLRQEGRLETVLDEEGLVMWRLKDSGTP